MVNFERSSDWMLKHESCAYSVANSDYSPPSHPSSSSLSILCPFSSSSSPLPPGGDHYSSPPQRALSPAAPDLVAWRSGLASVVPFHLLPSSGLAEQREFAEIPISVVLCPICVVLIDLFFICMLQMVAKQMEGWSGSLQRTGRLGTRSGGGWMGQASTVRWMEASLPAKGLR